MLGGGAEEISALDVISRSRVEKQLVATDPKLQKSYRTWLQVARAVQWRRFADVRGSIPSADQVGDCFVFNLQGNRFRLVCRIDFERGRIYLLHVLTHAEYARDEWKRDC